MNLIQMRTEVLGHGFDPTQYGARINQYLNDALALVARRVDYYVDESTSLFSTVNGTSLYPLPANWARLRSVFDTTRNVEMQYVSIRDIDRSSLSNGAPSFYALSGANMVLYPTPNAVFPMELRYWTMPPVLVNDTDIPTIPVDWHHMLWTYATWMCYESDDDSQMGDYWQKRFNTELAMFAADQKFPDSDGPTQARGMWDTDRQLAKAGQWSLYGW